MSDPSTFYVGLTLGALGLSALAANPIAKAMRPRTPAIPQPRTRAVHSGRKSGRTGVGR